jgi:MFS family permease
VPTVTPVLPPREHPDRLPGRTVRVLATTQVLGGVGVASGLAVGGLLAEDVSGSTARSGLVQTAAVLGAALAALPVARLMAARGRGPGLVAGYTAGMLGAAVVVVGAVASTIALLVVGSQLFGGGTAAGLQARYAATDLSPPGRRGRDLSTVVWATTIGSVLGPNMVGPGGRLGDAAGVPELAGPYVLSGVAFAAAAAVVLVLLRPDPLLEARRRAGGSSAPPAQRSVRAALAVVRRSPPATLALVAIASAHSVMVAVMVMTPVHMGHGGAHLRVVGLVISIHIAGMYALSPVVGRLADRLGAVRVILGGQALLLLAVLVSGSSPSHDSVRLAVGLGLLGVGWSAALIAGSTLLSESLPVAERPVVQGTADFVMGLCAAAAGALAGVALDTLGYGGLNAAAAVLVLPVLVAALRLRSAGGRPAVEQPEDGGGVLDVGVVAEAGEGDRLAGERR